MRSSIPQRARERRALGIALICTSAIAASCAIVAGDAPSQGVPRNSPADSVENSATLRAPRRDGAADLVIAALNFLDHPYQAGGQNADTGFDCSGFTRHLFDQTLGIQLPRRVDDQAHANALSQVPREALRAGDLVFFNTLRRTFSHVGIYVGDGRFIHAPRSGAQIRAESLTAAYWSRRFTGARRASVLTDEAAAPR